MPTNGRPRDLHKEQFWRQTLQRFAHSRLSPTQFCRLHKLPLHSFWAWQRTLRLRDRNHPKRPQHPGSTPANRKADELPVFLPISLPLAAEPPFTPTNQTLVEILLPNGLRLRLPQHCDADALQRLLAVLRGVPC